MDEIVFIGPKFCVFLESLNGIYYQTTASRQCRGGQLGFFRIDYLSGTDKALVVPAGYLDANPSLAPQDNIFWAERAAWYEEAIGAKHCAGFPEA